MCLVSTHLRGARRVDRGSVPRPAIFLTNHQLSWGADDVYILLYSAKYDYDYLQLNITI